MEEENYLAEIGTKVAEIIDSQVDEDLVEELTVGDEEEKKDLDVIPYYYSSKLLPGIRMNGDVRVAEGLHKSILSIFWFSILGIIIYGLLPLLYWPKVAGTIVDDSIFVFSFYYGIGFVVSVIILRFITKFNNETIYRSNYFQKTVRYQDPPESKVLYELEQKDKVVWKIVKNYTKHGNFKKIVINAYIILAIINIAGLIITKRPIAGYFLTMIYLVIFWSSMWFGFGRLHTSKIIEKAHMPKLHGYAHAKYWVSIRNDYLIFPLMHGHLPIVINNGFISYDLINDFGFDKYSVFGIDNAPQLVEYGIWLKSGEKIEFKISSQLADKLDFFLEKKVKKVKLKTK